MSQIEIALQIISTIVGLIGGGVGIFFWRENKAIKKAEADKSKTNARLAEADLAEKILEKYEKGILARMDSGDAVRKQEFQELTTKIDARFDTMEQENKSQNGLLSDIVEFLNGDFQEFERKKKNGKK